MPHDQNCSTEYEQEQSVCEDGDQTDEISTQLSQPVELPTVETEAESANNVVGSDSVMTDKDGEETPGRGDTYENNAVSEMPSKSEAETAANSSATELKNSPRTKKKQAGHTKAKFKIEAEREKNQIG